MRDAVKWAALEFSEWPFKDNKIIPIVVGINDDGSFYTDKPPKEYTCVFFDQWQATRRELGLDRPQWRGHEDGLPPVGTECESHISGTLWEKGRLKYIGKNLIVWESHTGSEYATRPSDRVFRPIRTEEEKAVEEMLKIACAAPLDYESIVRALYRAGLQFTEKERD